MALHLRTQIRDAVVTLLTGLATTGANVFVLPHRNLEATQLPALRVHVADEAIEVETSFAGMQRTADLEITAIAQETGDIEATLNQIVKEVEVQMQTDPQLSGLVDTAFPASISDMVSDLSGATPVAEQSIIYTVNYFTRAGAPDVPA